MMQENKESSKAYEFTMAVQADELMALLLKEELDIALIPANMASILYHRTQGAVSVIDINTLGVLYMVSGDGSIDSVEDLKGKTICLTGKGTTPDHVLHYILGENGLAESDYRLEYRSEASEVAAVLKEDPMKSGLLPQPFVTAACMQNPALETVLDMNEEWEKLQGEDGSCMVTGVTVVRKEFLEEHREAVEEFLVHHEESTQALRNKPQEGAVLAVEAGIIATEEIAGRAVTECNVVFLTGEQMKQALCGYLEVLYEQNPEAIGGALPEMDFYYAG